jgi:hypothetical protein
MNQPLQNRRGPIGGPMAISSWTVWSVAGALVAAESTWLWLGERLGTMSRAEEVAILEFFWTAIIAACVFGAGVGLLVYRIADAHRFTTSTAVIALVALIAVVAGDILTNVVRWASQ